MRRFTSRIVLGVAMFAACAGLAAADLSVTVNITGSIDEVLPLLRHLQDLGIGVTASGDDAPKLEVHSVMSGAEPAAPAPPVLGFQEVVIEPATAKPGVTVLVTARVSDPDKVVDTVAATIGGQTIDLFDNGSEGDAAALDGLWSRNIVLPATLPAGETVISVSAFDVNGDAVQLVAHDGAKSPMTALGAVNIDASEPAPAPPAPAAAPAQPAPAPQPSENKNG